MSRVLQEGKSGQAISAFMVANDHGTGVMLVEKPLVREKVKKYAGRGRCHLEVWPDLCIATVIKHTKKKRVVEIPRKVTRGTSEKAKELLALTKRCIEFNTAYIERLNGTVRERLAPLTRRCRHAAVRVATLEMGMYLIGCT
jgi:hypothetical protein